MKIRFHKIEQELNQAIHELVFAIHHNADGQSNWAFDCLTSASYRIDQIRKELLAPSAPPSVPSVASCKNQSPKKAAK